MSTVSASDLGVATEGITARSPLPSSPAPSVLIHDHDDTLSDDEKEDAPLHKSNNTEAPEARPRQIDPSDPSRTVAFKKQNTAYLAHQRFKMQEAERRREKRRRRGLPEDASGNDESSSMMLDGNIFRVMLKYTLLTLIAAMTMGQFVTGDIFYGYEGRWRNPKRWLPIPQRSFTPAELTLFNGREESRPVYISIMGNVYDVTEGGKTYRPGGSYWFFAGRDASRAYTTGCFKTHLTHDLRGLSDAEVEQVREWDRFFANNPKYRRVGSLRLPEIDPESPIPEPC